MISYGFRFKLFLIFFLRCICSSCFSYPCTVFPRFNASFNSLLIARSMSFDYCPEFFPIDFSKIIMASFFIPLQFWIGDLDTESLGGFQVHDEFKLGWLLDGKIGTPRHEGTLCPPTSVACG